jgi:microcystin-dependent protein
MALESGTYLNSLVTSNPTATDALAQADDHLRLIKSVLVNTFPNLAGAVTVTNGELNIIDGSTSATSVTLVDADTVVVNDGGTMVQVALSDLITYINAGMTLRDDVVTTASLGDAVVSTANLINGSVTNDKIAAGAISASKISADVSFSSGMVMPYAGSAGAPTGWLLCYGQEVSRVTYADLYTAIGTTYGVGDGSTTFALPDLRGRVIAGQDDMGGASANRLTSALNGDTLGATGGTEDVTLTAAQSGLPAHTHTTDLVTVNTGSGSNSAKTGYYHTSLGASGQDPIASTQTTRSEVSNSNTTQDASSSHSNVQPTAILNYIIKT